MKRALPYLAVAAVVGCSGATTAFTRTGPTLPSQPDTCEFSIVTAAPGESAKELGTIDIKYLKQTDWIYSESAFKRKVRTDVCTSGGDTVVAHINENGLYLSATVFTTKAAPVATPSPAAESSEPEGTAEAAAPAPAAPPPAAPAAAPEKGSQAAATPAKKDEPTKDDDATKAGNGKKRGKKGAGGKKDDDIHGKDGKVDIDKLL